MVIEENLIDENLGVNQQNSSTSNVEVEANIIKETNHDINEVLQNELLAKNVSEYSQKDTSVFPNLLKDLSHKYQNKARDNQEIDILLIQINALLIVAYERGNIEEENGVYFLQTEDDIIEFPNISQYKLSVNEIKQQIDTKEEGEIEKDINKAEEALEKIKELTIGHRGRKIATFIKLSSTQVIEFLDNLNVKVITEENKERPWERRKSIPSYKIKPLVLKEIKILLINTHGNTFWLEYENGIKKENFSRSKKNLEYQKSQLENNKPNIHNKRKSDENKGPKVSNWKSGVVEKSEDVLIYKVLKESWHLRKMINTWMKDMFALNSKNKQLKLLKDKLFSTSYSYASQDLEINDTEKKYLKKITSQNNYQFKSLCEVLVRQLISEILKEENIYGNIKNTSLYDDTFAGIDFIHDKGSEQIGIDLAISDSPSYLYKKNKQKISIPKEYNLSRGLSQHNKIERKVLGIPPYIIANLLDSYLSKVQINEKMPSLLDVYKESLEKEGIHDPIKTKLRAIVK